MNADEIIINWQGMKDSRQCFTHGMDGTHQFSKYPRPTIEEESQLTTYHYQWEESVYIEVNKGLYVVARNVFLLFHNCSAWPCLGPA